MATIKPAIGKAMKAPSESDMGSMKGYDPNMGLPKAQVPNSNYTPKTGPAAPGNIAKPAIRRGASPMKINPPGRMRPMPMQKPERRRSPRPRLNKKMIA
jgi:hypothetical protein